MAKSSVTVKQPEPPEASIPTEVLAESIVRLSEVGKQLGASRLRRRLVCLLLKDMTGIGINDIDRILNALPELEKTYLKPS